MTIGVTGHRALSDSDKIAGGIDKALRKVEDTFPGQSLAVISPLAEGADRLVARRVLARSGARLVVPMSMPQPEYVGEFEADTSRRELLDLLARANEVVSLPPVQTRQQAYAAANRDVLIAVWDGQEAQGPGGTGHVVALARHRRLPVTWVRAANRRLGSKGSSAVAVAEGKTLFERFPPPTCQGSSA